MTVLLDSNVLIALLVDVHVHHRKVEGWLAGSDEPFATCPVTEGAFVRLVVREGATAKDAIEVLAELARDERHRFWPADRPYAEVRTKGVVGHRQVTDAYLAQLARAHEGRLVTLDAGLAAAQRDVVELLGDDR